MGIDAESKIEISFDYYKDNYENWSHRKMVDNYNKLKINERLAFLDYLAEISKEEKSDFIDILRSQAVDDFWTHERELIEQGLSTRDWSPDQIEAIMNLKKNGYTKIDGGKAIDLNGKAYYGHHMIDVHTHPEYAGDWRNVQALDYTEHYVGAHNDFHTKEPTEGFYNFDEGHTEIIEIPSETELIENPKLDPFDNVEIINKRKKSIFESDATIKNKYNLSDNVTTGELLALKNMELSLSESGTITDFNRSLALAEKYKITDFETKYNIPSNVDLTAKYSFFDSLSEEDKATLKATEYINSKTENKYKVDICFDVEGNTIGVEVVKNGNNFPEVSTKGEVAYKNNIAEIADFVSDKEMIEIVGNERWKQLTATERLETKEFEKVVRDIQVVGDKTYSADLVESYLKASNKSIDSLDNTDKVLIGIADKISNKLPDGSIDALNLKYIKSAEKYGKILKKVEVAGNVLDVTANMIFFGIKIYEANEAIQKGDTNKAVGIITSATAEFTVSTVGGIVLTDALMPYCVGFGAAIGGPFGAILGGVVAGVIGYGSAGIVGEEFGDLIAGIFESLDDNYNNASSVIRYVADPLVLDFDGDGFETLSVKEGVYFDEDATGLVEKTAWVSKDDALLALDIDENGTIDNGSELFGTSTKLANGKFAKNGFEALSQYDLNSDNIIDENDEIYSKLLVWQDKNSDGISQESELLSLKKAGITSIALDTNNETGRNVAAVTFSDGTIRNLGEFDFDAQYFNTIEKEKIDISEEIENFPDIKAMGNVQSLHTLMQKDQTGELKGYVEAFANSTNKEDKEALVTQILYFITGANNVSSNSRGNQIDAKKLTVVEKIMGKNFVGTNGRNPVNTAAPILNNIYSDIFNTYYCLLNSQTQLADYMKLLCIIENKNGTKTINTAMFNKFIKICRDNGADMSEIVGEMGRYIKTINKSNASNFNEYMSCYFTDKKYLECIVKTSYSDYFTGSDENDSYTGSESDDALFGGNGNDKLNGANGNDIIYGENGNDSLYGGNGDDVLVGGAGNDYLSGDYGNDTYVFNLGDGQDTICEYESSATSGKADKIVFGEGIKEEDVKLHRAGNNLIIRYSDKDQVTVKDAYYYGDDRTQIENIEFADGTVWGVKEITQKCDNMIYGTEGNDVIYGYSKMSQYDNSKETFYAGAGNDTVYGEYGSDIIYGETGNDSLYGGNGDDVLVGGSGNDYLSGDYGNDTYVFNLGDGQDTICEYESSATSGKADKIVFGEGIKEEDVKLHRAGNNLIIRYSDKDQVTVKDAYYYGDDRTQIENIELTESGLYILNYDKLELELIKSCVYESDEVNYNQVVENMELMCVISENSLTNIDVESTIQEQIVDESNMAESIDCESEMMSSEIEGMANLLVQEMAEFQTGNIVYDTQSISTTENNENVQLWTQD